MINKELIRILASHIYTNGLASNELAEDGFYYTTLIQTIASMDNIFKEELTDCVLSFKQNYDVKNISEYKRKVFDTSYGEVHITKLSEFGDIVISFAIES